MRIPTSDRQQTAHGLLGHSLVRRKCIKMDLNVAVQEGRDMKYFAIDDAHHKKGGDKSWLRGAGQLWKVDKFDRKNYR